MAQVCDFGRVSDCIVVWFKHEVLPLSEHTPDDVSETVFVLVEVKKRRPQGKLTNRKTDAVTQKYPIN